MLDRPALIKRIEAGEAFTFLCFYGHAVHSPVTKTCFSQWYPAPFTVGRVVQTMSKNIDAGDKSATEPSDELSESTTNDLTFPSHAAHNARTFRKSFIEPSDRRILTESKSGLAWIKFEKSVSD